MKILSQPDPLVAQDTPMAQTSLNISMLVLGDALTDLRVLREATALAEAGFAVSIVDIQSEKTVTAEEYVSDVCLKHILMSNKFISTRRWSFLIAAQLFIRSIFRLIETKADIYHAHDASALPACFIASLLCRKQLVFDAHELPLSERPLSEMSRSQCWLHKVLTVLLRCIVPYCAGLITVSPPIADEIRTRYHIRQVSLVRNTPKYQIVARSDRLHQYLGLDPKTRIALYQGVLHSERGLKQLISAAAFLEQDNVIIMMGNGPIEMISELTSLIAHKGVADHVKIIPAVPYEELLSWTISANIGLIIYPPNYSLNVQMCLPNKFFEYLMAGLPVLASQLDAVGEAIRTYDVGQVVSSLEPAVVGAAINAMLADHNALARMQHNALEAAKQEFNWEKEKERLLHLYHKLSSTTGNIENSVRYSD